MSGVFPILSGSVFCPCFRRNRLIPREDGLIPPPANEWTESTMSCAPGPNSGHLTRILPTQNNALAIKYAFSFFDTSQSRCWDSNTGRFRARLIALNNQRLPKDRNRLSQICRTLAVAYVGPSEMPYSMVSASGKSCSIPRWVSRR